MHKTVPDTKKIGDRWATKFIFKFVFGIISENTGIIWENLRKVLSTVLFMVGCIALMQL